MTRTQDGPNVTIVEQDRVDQRTLTITATDQQWSDLRELLGEQPGEETATEAFYRALVQVVNI